MAHPNDTKLLTALRAATYSIYKRDPSSLSVRSVRDKATQDLGLDNGFFVKDDWKSKSKEVITNHAEFLIEKDVEQTSDPSPVEAKPRPKKKTAAPVHKGTKRDEKARPAKRQKKQKTPSESSDDELIDEEESVPSPKNSEEESSFGASDNDELKPKKKSAPQFKAIAKKKKKNAASSDDEDEESLSDAPSSTNVSPPPKKKTTPKKVSKTVTRKPHTKKGMAGSESEDEEESKPSVKSTLQKEVPKAQSSKAEDSDTEDKLTPKGEDSESEISVVVDEAPPPKRKRSSKAKSNEGKPSSSKSKTKTLSAPKLSKDLSPDEALLKTLQSQLKKCGVNKIFQFELKKFGDDTKAKIKHLQKELKDVGMTGRFSETRAREIKEERELMADVEAVREGEEKWGRESGWRASRAEIKSLRERTGSNEEEEDEEDGKNVTRSGSESEAPRKQRARQDLAFLDDDEEDSD